MNLSLSFSTCKMTEKSSYLTVVRVKWECVCKSLAHCLVHNKCSVNDSYTYYCWKSGGNRWWKLHGEWEGKRSNMTVDSLWWMGHWVLSWAGEGVRCWICLVEKTWSFVIRWWWSLMITHATDSLADILYLANICHSQHMVPFLEI